MAQIAAAPARPEGNVTELVQPEKPVKAVKSQEMKRYDDIQAAWGAGDRLLLSEHTVLRNILEGNINKQEYAVVKTVAGGGKKLAGVFCKKDISEDEAEDVVMAENYEDPRVLIIPRTSVAITKL